VSEPLFETLRQARAGRPRPARGVPRPRSLLVLSFATVAALALLAWSGRSWITETVRPLRTDQRMRRLADPIREAASEHGLDPYLLAGLVSAESSARLDAVSSVDALGLCQLKLTTAEEQARRMGLASPTREQLLSEPRINLRLGAGYLARLVERQDGSVERALMAYNTGPSRFARWLEDAGGYEAWRAEVDAQGPPGPGSVRHYASRVLEEAERLRGAGLFELDAERPGAE
jgi:soluble lytic murein transglycosylase-like protein